MIVIPACGPGGVLAAGVERVDGRTGGAVPRMLLARARRVDVALLVDGQRGDLLLGRAVEDESIAIRRDSIHQATAVGAGDQIALGDRAPAREYGLRRS